MARFKVRQLRNLIEDLARAAAAPSDLGFRFELVFRYDTDSDGELELAGRAGVDEIAEALGVGFDGGANWRRSLTVLSAGEGSLVVWRDPKEESA